MRDPVEHDLSEKAQDISNALDAMLLSVVRTLRESGMAYDDMMGGFAKVTYLLASGGGADEDETVTVTLIGRGDATNGELNMYVSRSPAASEVDNVAC